MGMILGFLGMIFLALFVRLLGVEIAAQHMPFCRRLVRFAAARLPADERVAAESEWLQVIKDLHSPTRQFIHSASFVLSAYRIREAIAPEQPSKSVARTALVIHTSSLTFGASVSLIFLWLYHDALVEFAERHVHLSKPAAVAGLMISMAWLIAVNYWGYRFWVWSLTRRERRRANMSVD